MKIEKCNIIKNIFILFLVFVLISSVVEANYYWSQEGNANYESSIAGNNYIAYGSNYRNPTNMSYYSSGFNYTQEGYNYTLCSITKSDYTPISADFTRNGILEVVVTDLLTNKLSIYDTKCNLIDEIIVEGVHYEEDLPTNLTHKQNIVAMPVLMDSNTKCIDNSDPMYPIFKLCADYSPEIFVLTNESLKGYTYNFATGGFEESSSENYQNEVDKPLDFLTCFQSVGAGKCFALSSDHNDAIIFPIGGDAISVPNNLNEPDINVVTTILKYSGLSNMRIPTSLLEFYVPFGFYATSYSPSTPPLGTLLKDWGDVIIEYGDEHLVYYRPISSSDFVAKHGNLFRVFSYRYGGYGENSFQYALNVYDLSGNNLFSILSNKYEALPYKYSNIVVSDFDKDGSNEMCFLDKYRIFNCYNSNFELLPTIDYSENMTIPYNIVMADFYPSYGSVPVVGKGDLCIGSVEGIFCSAEKVFSTGKTGDGFPITIFKDIYSKVPALVYADDSQGFIVYADIEIDTCGDGICQYWENSLSCPQDCDEEFEPPEEEVIGGEGYGCITDEDCANGLKCEYGVCTKLSFNEECTKNSDCISGICLNGKCTKPSLWLMIDKSKNQQFGNDTPTNNILSIAIILTISTMVGYYINVWGGIASLFMLSIFFTMVGWLSGFILVGIVIVGAIALFFGLMLKGSNN